MKLNESYKKRYSKIINEKLKDVDKNHSIKLPNEVIEEFLFMESKNNKNSTFKKIIFEGDNLKKLDLSDISFEDVSFVCSNGANLSNINACIDFKKTFDYKTNKEFSIANVDFSGTDLSNTSLDGVTKIINTNLSNTKVNISDKPFKALNSSFAGLDLSNIQVPLSAFTSNLNFNSDYSFVNCDLRDTGINIKVDKDVTLKATYGSERFYIDAKKQLGELLHSLIESEKIRGCYVNGIFIESKENRKNKKEEIRKEFEDFYSKKVNKTLILIDNGKSSGGKYNN